VEEWVFLIFEGEGCKLGDECELRPSFGLGAMIEGLKLFEGDDKGEWGKWKGS